MIDDKHGPRVVEYNVRFGDPECQVIMTRLKDDPLRNSSPAPSAVSPAAPASNASRIPPSPS